MSVGTVGRPHGRDGSFYVDRAAHALPEGLTVRVGGVERRIERRAGTDQRPLVRLDGAAERDDAAALQGSPLFVSEEESPLGEGEWLVEDLVGCTVPGLGEVRRVVLGSSCDLLEVGEGATLVPLVSDAVRSVDLERRVIDVDLRFLGAGGG